VNILWGCMLLQVEEYEDRLGITSGCPFLIG
jgi:hypothetical protein